MPASGPPDVELQWCASDGCVLLCSGSALGTSRRRRAGPRSSGLNIHGIVTQNGRGAGSTMNPAVDWCFRVKLCYPRSLWDYTRLPNADAEPDSLLRRQLLKGPGRTACNRAGEMEPEWIRGGRAPAMQRAQRERDHSESMVGNGGAKRSDARSIMAARTIAPALHAPPDPAATLSAPVEQCTRSRHVSAVTRQVSVHTRAPSTLARSVLVRTHEHTLGHPRSTTP
eukprot:3412784-Rhodomonas_salina.9